ncbi:hypothetical protein CF327_g6213 [Tilletia walkeri]|uniref:DASH complex subunit SPC19 n=1 Tax=Tilletia walkeri TaxID=117179 RepID=A0A8X7N4X0_9BASI|nr:hypothetical protein CF327_g6213 [Tilletia walkeri]KAE8267142.1 hypothetical protein A4X09_0g5204 [Tilletia walkeri]
MSYARQSIYAPLQPHQLQQSQLQQPAASAPPLSSSSAFSASSLASSSASTSSNPPPPPVFFNQSINNQLASLQACTYSLESANQTLAHSVDTLREATADFPRLAVALANKKHFDLVAEQEIIRAKEHLAAEIAPQLHELILRAESAVERVERKARAAKNRAQQAAAKLEQQQPRSTASSTAAPVFVPSAFRPPPALSAEASKSLPDVSEAQLNQLRAQVEAARRRKTQLDERARQLEAEADILAACR